MSRDFDVEEYRAEKDRSLFDSAAAEEGSVFLFDGNIADIIGIDDAKILFFLHFDPVFLCCDNHTCYIGKAAEHADAACLADELLKHFGRHGSVSSFLFPNNAHNAPVPLRNPKQK